TNNWTFNLAQDKNTDPNAKPSAWSFRLDNILFDQGRIAIDDKEAAGTQSLATGHAGSAEPELVYGLRFRTFNVVDDCNREALSIE
ncbi:hypothetical protein MJM43_29420, partial [Salmonella enterica subsp. enterica serovar Montevideo]|nr:hypothetical protein [Salmonella enterica subsp. enterica serovar Montevideo]